MSPVGKEGKPENVAGKTAHALLEQEIRGYFSEAGELRETLLEMRREFLERAEILANGAGERRISFSLPDSLPICRVFNSGEGAVTRTVLPVLYMK